MAFFDSSVSELFIGATDYKAYATDIDGVPGERALVPVTAIGDLGTKSIPSLQSASPSIGVLFDNTTLDAILAALRTATAGQVLTYWPGGDTNGDRGWGIGSVFSAGVSNQSSVGNAVAATLSLESDSIVEPIIGLLDSGKATVTATGNDTSIDDLTPSSNGGSFYYHIFAITATGGNAQWEVILQDSTDDAVFATFATATIGTGVTGSARVNVAGTFDRYVRARRVLDASSGSMTWVSGYIRD